MAREMAREQEEQMPDLPKGKVRRIKERGKKGETKEGKGKPRKRMGETKEEDGRNKGETKERKSDLLWEGWKLRKAPISYHIALNWI